MYYVCLAAPCSNGLPGSAVCGLYLGRRRVNKVSANFHTCISYLFAPLRHIFADILLQRSDTGACGTFTKRIWFETTLYVRTPRSPVHVHIIRTSGEHAFNLYQYGKGIKQFAPCQSDQHAKLPTLVTIDHDFPVCNFRAKLMSHSREPRCQCVAASKQ